MFGIKITKESELETRLIEQLTSGVSQWVYRPDLRTEEDLWNNFREKLEQNNKAILKGAPITDAELNQIKGRLNFATFFDAAKWLVGENGIARVTLQREDASLGTVHLDVLRRQDVAGGTSSYEVINQYQADKRRKIERVMAPIFAKSITSSGNSSNKLDHNHFLNKELLVPNIDEQKKIGTLLSILSKNITLHQCKLEKLKEMKRFFLQHMFV